MKIFSWFCKNILFIISLFLLAFIPLYPKLPLVDIQHTWVYIRVEDVLIALVAGVWISLLALKKVSLKTPLTLPIVIFWIVGGVATLHGVLLIFPQISGIYSNVAFLSYMRKIEYMLLFFVAYSGIKDKKNIYGIIVTLSSVLVLVVLYGLGQKYFGFPAFLTMNEEFAKGTPIQISELSRVPSTFAGHYDLAAYLVLMIPILVSLGFGFKNLFLKFCMFAISGFGFVMLFMTVSRVSFFVLLLSMVLLLVLHKKRVLIVSLLLLNLVFLGLFPTLLARFSSTVTEIDVLVNAKTGNAIGNVKQISSGAFESQTVVRKTFENQRAVFGLNQEIINSDIQASSSAIVPFVTIPPQVFVLAEPNAPTGEDLPQGTGYINLGLSPIKEKLSQFFYELPAKDGFPPTNKIVAFQGNFLVKRARAYDLSYTTRFQGEWPNTLVAFKRNIFFGSGYGSVSLAVDNNYLRILGESGILGLLAFLGIFLVAGLYIKKILPQVDSLVTRSLVIGFVAGTFGLALNAVLIDVFEASKIAFTYWTLMGLILGLITLYKKEAFNLSLELKRVLNSAYTSIVGIGVVVVTLYSGMYSNYFVGDDFTWLRWISEKPVSSLLTFFTQSDGFFYRPGTKLYFYVMYSTFWLNQTAYHFVSLFLHFIFATLFYLLARKVLKNNVLSILCVGLFLVLSGYSEQVFWISSTGHIFNAIFILLSLLFYISWKESRKLLYFVLAVISIALGVLFHELGVVAPLLLIAYDRLFWEKSIKSILYSIKNYVLFMPVVGYLIIRYLSSSHWFNGDYSYNIVKLPYNIFGNILGYGMLDIIGPSSLSMYEKIRDISRVHVFVSFVLGVGILTICWFLYKRFIKHFSGDEKRILLFGFALFFIALLPFIGLGNIALRYNYLSSLGFVVIFVVLFKKIYEYLSCFNGKTLSLLVLTVVLLVFSSVHLFQLQKIGVDWEAGGNESERFLISLNEIYSYGWKTESIKLYFVNVPIRYGDAWIFPVGLKDAIWFVYKNKNISVYQVSSAKEAFDQIQDTATEKVFLFDETGAVKEQVPPQKNIQLK